MPLCISNRRHGLSASQISFLIYAVVGMLPWVAPGWAQGEIFVNNDATNSVMVFSRLQNGDNIGALRTISGPATGLLPGSGLSVDTVHNELAVAEVNVRSVQVFPLFANGNVAPLRTISGPATGLSDPFFVAADPVNNELVVTNAGPPGSWSVTVYARAANGNVAPLRTIAGAATGVSNPLGVAVDTVNDELVVVNQTFVGNASAVMVYARTANGNVSPLRTISGAATGLIGSMGVAVDTVNNELVVVGSPVGGPPYVMVFPRTANGNVAPLRNISGPATFLGAPFAVAVDTVNNELVVANFNGGNVAVYARMANGNVSPLRTISESATGLAPAGIAVTNGPETAIPTLSPAMLVVLALGLATLALRMLRKTA